MVSQPPVDDTLAARTAARAAVESAADRVRGAEARACGLAAGIRWRSRGFDAFRARVDEWGAELSSLRRALDSAPAHLPGPTVFWPWADP
jgi:hypothetical protein